MNCPHCSRRYVRTDYYNNHIAICVAKSKVSYLTTSEKYLVMIVYKDFKKDRGKRFSDFDRSNLKILNDVPASDKKIKSYLRYIYSEIDLLDEDRYEPYKKCITKIIDKVL